MNQREIKFRAVIREDKIIKEIGSIEFFTDGTIIVNGDIPIKRLLEFTGLKDKNGVEIYEGSILKNKGEVIYQAGGFEVGKAAIEAIPIKDIPIGELEVIGDIYQNPELLK